jgi:arsenite-transporting ATPase
MDELMAFIGISEWADARRYDCMVVDTAPGGHTLRLLAMPDMIGRWLGMLDALLAKRRYMRKVFSRSVSPDRLDIFVSDWKSCVARMERLLRDPARCRFVPVTVAEPLALEVTAGLLRELSSRKIPVTDIIVNRLHCENGCPVCSAAASTEQAQIRQLAEVSGPSASLWGIELFAEEVRGSEPLAGFWEACWQIEGTGAATYSGGPEHVLPEGHVLHEPAVVDPPAAPASGRRLLLLAGKGGVGKTTLSCATAIRFARDFPQKRILLFSTDPAHSLTACLHVEIGNRFKDLLPNLAAIEIDATVEFDKLKARYSADVARFLRNLSSNFDLTFDRVVFEKLMDLAPPGLDEIMALIRIVNLLADGSYDVFVLDCAPTGHLIRLLELPDIVNEWLKSFFNLFLKYERIFRLPAFAEELIGISRNLKKLRAVLLDPVQSALYAVGIPTQMALGETQDLLASCDRMGLSVPLIFLNLMTPPSTCRLCRRLVERESLEADAYSRSFPDRHLTLLYRQPDLGSMEMLGELGRRLFADIRQEGKSATA